MGYLKAAVAVILVLTGAGCNETSTEIIDTPVSVETDDTLPDGFVRDNRPANPPDGHSRVDFCVDVG